MFQKIEDLVNRTASFFRESLCVGAIVLRSGTKRDARPSPTGSELESKQAHFLSSFRGCYCVRSLTSHLVLPSRVCPATHVPAR